MENNKVWDVKALQCCLFIFCVLVSTNVQPFEWKSIQVSYDFDPEFKKGSKFADKWAKYTKEVFETKTITVKIPADLKKGELIKGVIAYNRSFEVFAHKKCLFVCCCKSL